MSSFFYFVTVTGNNQGTFKGESQVQQREDCIPCVRLRYKTYVPTDATKGVSAGLVRHEPLVITKPFGQSSPQFLQALWDNEVLKEVKIEFVLSDGHGNTDVTYEELVLKNATVAFVERYTDKMDQQGAVARSEFEDIGFRFEEINVRNVSGKVVARYRWNEVRSALPTL